jgi:hypothetical protein
VARRAPLGRLARSLNGFRENRAQVGSARLLTARAKADVVIESIYTGLLITVFLVIVWFASYVVYKLYHGQR